MLNRKLIRESKIRYDNRVSVDVTVIRYSTKAVRPAVKKFNPKLVK